MSDVDDNMSKAEHTINCHHQVATGSICGLDTASVEAYMDPPNKVKHLLLLVWV